MDKYRINKSAKKAFSLIEVLLAVALLAIMVTTLVSGLIYGQQNTEIASKREQATYIAHEGLSATRSIRDVDFANLTDGTYGLTVASGVWQLSGSSDTNNGYTRSITISTVSTNIKQIISQVSWSQNLQRQGAVSEHTYLSNWHRSSSSSPWSNIQELGALNFSAGNAGIAIDRDGDGDNLYVVRAAGNDDFAIADISTVSTPTQLSSVNITNTANGVAYSNNHTLVTTTSNSSEVLVIDVTNPASPSTVNTVNLTGNADATDVDIDGNYAYVTRGSSSASELVVLDISTITAPTVVGGLELGDSANKVTVSGNYLFIASNNNSQELQIVDISTPTAPTLAGSYNVSGTVNASSISVGGNYAVLGMVSGQVLIIDISTVALPILKGSYNANDIVNASAIYGNTVYLATDYNSAELQVIDISNPLVITLIGSVDISFDLNDIIYDSTEDMVITAGDNANNEIIIFGPL